jgi:hypothetical protein
LRIAERDRQTLARWWFGLTALAVFIGVVVNGVVAYRADNGFFSPGIARFFNTFAFFTVQSNILVGLSCYLLFRDHIRESTWFRALRLSGLVGITITGIVYHWLLAGLHELRGMALVGDLIVHSVVPLIAVLGFFSSDHVTLFRSRLRNSRCCFLPGGAHSPWFVAKLWTGIHTHSSM